MRPLVSFGLVALLGGCLAQAPTDEIEHRFGGSFTESATQGEIADFDARMRAHGGVTAVLESFPPQFRVSGFGATSCQAARAEARNLTYVASTNACARVETVQDPDGATSTSAGQG